jgi:hypothetical protein
MSTSEQPPERPQRFSDSASRKPSWPRIISGFVAGVICTFLIVMFSREAAPPLGQLAKSVQEAPRTQPAQSSETKSVQPAAEPSPQQAAQVPAPAPAPSQGAAAARTDTAATTGAAPPAEVANTAPPPAAESPRSVRVIPTDRDAATKRVGNAPAATSNGPSADRNSARTTDGSASSGATAEQAKATHNGRPAASSSDTKPSVAAHPEPDATSSRSSSRQSAREAREQRRAARERDREARREAERSERRRTARTADDADVTTPAFDDEVRRERDDTRRATRETRETSRSSRKRSNTAREDDDDTIVVQRGRDGRELTIYEQPRRERQVETRRIIHEEPARPRLPFFLDLFNPGGREN